MNLINFMRWNPDLWKGWQMPAGTDNLDPEALKAQIVFRYGQMTPAYDDPDVMQEMITLWCLTNAYTIKTLYETTQLQYNPIENYDRHEWYKYTDDRVLNSQIDENRTNDYTGKTNDDFNGNVTLVGSQKLDGKVTVDETVTPNTTTKVDSTVDNNRSAFNAGAYSPYDQQVTDSSTVVSGTNDTDGTTLTDNTQTTNDKTTTIDNRDINVTQHDTDDNNRNQNDTENVDHEHRGHTHGNIGVTTTQQMIEQERAVALFNLYEEIAKIFAKDLMVCVWPTGRGFGIV